MTKLFSCLGRAFLPPLSTRSAPSKTTTSREAKAFRTSERERRRTSAEEWMTGVRRIAGEDDDHDHEASAASGMDATAVVSTSTHEDYASLASSGAGASPSASAGSVASSERSSEHLVASAASSDASAAASRQSDEPSRDEPESSYHVHVRRPESPGRGRSVSRRARRISSMTFSESPPRTSSARPRSRSPSPEVRALLRCQRQEQNRVDGACGISCDRTVRRSGRTEDSVDDLDDDERSYDESTFDCETSAGSRYRYEEAQRQSADAGRRQSTNTAASNDPSVDIWIQCEDDFTCQDSLTFDEDWSRDPIRARKEDALKLDCDDDMRERLENYILALAAMAEE